MKLRKRLLQLPNQEIVTEARATSNTPCFADHYVFTREELEEFFIEAKSEVLIHEGHISFDGFMKESGCE